MTDKAVVAVVQRAFGLDRDENREATVVAVEEAIAEGAGIILPPELFEGRYFPQREEQEYFSWATTPEDNPAIAAVQKVTAGTGAVVPVSFFEAARPAYFNSVAVIEDGVVLGVYRKSHIPDGPGYEEKFYFNPGTRAFGPGPPATVGWAWGSAGINGSPRPQGPWRCKVRTCSFTRRRSGARWGARRAMTPRTCGGGPWRATPSAITCPS